MLLVLSPEKITLGRRPTPKRGTFYIQTWGCQMNDEDSEQMSLYLRDLGYEPTESLFEASVILLNTCSVRKKPEDKAFSMMGELIPLKKRNPDLILGVCGCMAQARADEIRRRAPHVDFVLGTGDLGLLPSLVEEAARGKRFQKSVTLPERRGALVGEIPQRHLGRAPKIKSFVPIQYGCDKFCTFCIVPTTRGRERSRPFEHVVEEVATLAASGTREVTLLGQTVNSYGKNLLDGQKSFAELLWRLSEIPELERIRYTSPYPRDFTAELISTIRDCPKVMEHCHLPLQSGSNEVLKQMHRVYSVESYLEIVEQLRSQVPGIALTTDIIVGFPGETDEQFEETMAMMEKVRFAGAYMFAYSIRPNTKAGDRADQIPEPTKKERLNRLIAVQNRVTCEVNAEFVGRELEVLVEGRSPKNREMLQGYSRDFKMLHFSGGESRIGRVAKGRVTGSHLWGLSAELI
ncbi:MAG TPA: tRNA (N6-isopentenyl adenosine(37)-C2)-methylthiotransferase MiaB [Fimbriimonas sp.]|nr:tRNA (N6-isopentenyl adenosine(37)-C2)-methylthiotransferase MiaB [Fimbriimonas sp.]